MRHSAYEFSSRMKKLDSADFDAIFATSMTHLGEIFGFCPEWAEKPSLMYFHENQFAYPDSHGGERDLHLSWTQVMSGMASDRLAFNSAWNRDSFLEGAEAFLSKMPDYRSGDIVPALREKSVVLYPGIEPVSCPLEKDDKEPLKIVWVGRFEKDKNPKDFYDALRLLRQNKTDFRFSMVGEQFSDSPPEFEMIRGEFSSRIDHWGWQPDREDYLKVLCECDVVVSTALQEFFGLAVLEAMICGCIPLLPDRLSYSELIKKEGRGAGFLYSGSAESLMDSLDLLSRQKKEKAGLSQKRKLAVSMASRYSWNNQRQLWDQCFQE